MKLPILACLACAFVLPFGSSAVAADLDPISYGDLQCVVLLGIMQGAKESGQELAILPDDLDKMGEKWSRIVVTGALERSGKTEDDLNDLINAMADEETQTLQLEDETAEARQSRVNMCVVRMESELARN